MGPEVTGDPKSMPAARSQAACETCRAMLHAPPWGTARHFLTRGLRGVKTSMSPCGGSPSARNHPYQRRQPVTKLQCFANVVANFKTLPSCVLARWWRRKVLPFQLQVAYILAGDIAQSECLRKSARWSVKKFLEPWVQDVRGGKRFGKLVDL